MLETTKDTQAAKILKLLKRNGYMTNHELADAVGHRFGGRLFDLRADGHVITSVHDKGSTWRYVYQYEDGEKVPLTARIRLRKVGVTK